MELSNGKRKLIERVNNDFTYHKPPPAVHSDFATIREVARNLATIMVLRCPEGRELSTALTNLEQAVMHANAGIARQYPAAPQPPLPESL